MLDADANVILISSMSRASKGVAWLNGSLWQADGRLRKIITYLALFSRFLLYIVRGFVGIYREPETGISYRLVII